MIEELKILLVSNMIRGIVGSKIGSDAVVTVDGLSGEIELALAARSTLPTMSRFLAAFRKLYSSAEGNQMAQAFNVALRTLGPSSNHVVEVARERVAAAIVFCETAEGTDKCAPEILEKLDIVYGDDENGALGSAVLVLRPKNPEKEYGGYSG
jgi:hypothetical protein